jgi:uncharacterized SAM-binding protein YcdF (DUF218 family)
MGWNSAKTLIVLGKGFVRDDISGKVRLSIESQLAALAAAALYEDELINHAIFCGGQTAGKHHLSEAESMLELAVQNGFPRDEYLLEKHSLDTHQNAENLGKLIDVVDGLRRTDYFHLLSVSFHLPRAKEIFRRHGFAHMNTYASDEILIESRSAGGQMAAMYRKSWRFTSERMKERISRLIQRLDPEGESLRKVVRRVRYAA